MTANGSAVHTGWAGSGTGLLVNSATSTSINNLFGSNSVDGFTALQAVDSNHDGVINASDTGFAGLYVWQDAKGNGVVANDNYVYEGVCAALFISLGLQVNFF